MKCNKDKVTQKTILSSVQGIGGVKKVCGQNFDRRFGSHVNPGVSQPLHSRDDQLTGALSPHVSTGVAKLHAANLTGSGLRIAVVDSGFDVDVPGFSKTAITYTHDLTDNDNDVRDDCSFHGTHVLGVLGSKRDESRYGLTSVAPDASYRLYRIQPCGRSGDDDILINAFLEAADRGVEMISCSFGGGQGFPEGKNRSEGSTDWLPLIKLTIENRRLICRSCTALRKWQLHLSPKRKRWVRHLLRYQP